MVYTDILGEDLNFENYKKEFSSCIMFYKQNKGEIEISVESDKEETNKFLKDKLSLSKETIENLRLDGKGLLSIKESQFKNVLSYSLDDFRKLNDFSKLLGFISYYVLLIIQGYIK